MRLRHLVLVLVALGIAIAVSPHAEPFERRAWDSRLRLRHDGGWPADLVLVPIDDDAIEHVGKRWPWPRDQQARLLTRVRALGATTLFYDAVLEGLTDPAADAAMAGALEDVVLALGFHGGREDRATPEAVRLAITLPGAVAARWPGSGFVPANETFLGAAAGQGHISSFSDPDRVLRRFAPALGVQRETGAIPIASMYAWARHRGIRPQEITLRDGVLVLPGGRKLPIIDGGVPIDFVPGGRSPPTVPAALLLDEKRTDDSLRPLFEGRLAIVYIDSLFTTDVIATPIQATTPGGLMHAYVVRTLDGGRVPTPLPRWLAWAIAAIPAAFVAAGAVRVPALVVARRMLVTAAGFAALSIALVPLADLFLPVVAPMGFLAATTFALVVMSSRTAEEDRARLKSLLAAATSVDAKTSRVKIDPAGFPEPLSEAPAPSVILGRYEIVRRLGRGGMGAVYLARDRDLSREVAIKVLEAAHEAEAFSRFRREALAVARLSHPNVVQIYEVGFDSQAPYLVMEYVPGGTIADVLRDRDQPLPWKQATRIAADIARGLGAAHVRGVVHRDVKPANVLLVEGGGAKVTDFGIAKLAGEAGLTREGWFIGTLGYASPEQVRGRPVDSRSDVYSLGLTWYRMLTGISAFHGEAADIILQSSEAVPDPRVLLPDLPLAVSELFARLCAVDPAGRPPHGDAAAKALDALAGSA